MSTLKYIKSIPFPIHSTSGETSRGYFPDVCYILQSKAVLKLLIDLRPTNDFIYLCKNITRPHYIDVRMIDISMRICLSLFFMIKKNGAAYLVSPK